MKIDFKNWKKVAQADDHTVFRNKDGHELKVGHKGLHPATRGQLAALPLHQDEAPKAVKMADGGEVQEPLQIATEMPVIPEALMAPKDVEPKPEAPDAVHEMTPVQAAVSSPEKLPYGVSPENVAEMTSPVMADRVPAVAAAPQAAPAPASAGAAKPEAADPYGTTAYQNAYMAGLNSEKAGLALEAKAAETQGKAQAELLGKQQAIQAQQASEYQRHYQALDSERQALLKDIQDKHIDPNRFVANLDTGSRIATAIGLIASGMGAGMAHQENAAVNFLHKQIDNDIKAQQAELGKKENLLSANMRQFGNMRDAMDMTRVMQSDILANQLKMEAAKQMGPMAKANLLKAAGELEMKSAPVLSQIAMRKTLMSGMSKGQVAPEAVIRMVVPEHEQAAATKELKEAQGAYRAKDNVLSAFDKAAQLNTVGNKLTSPLQTKRQVAALVQPIIAGLSKETAGRFTEQDAHMLATLFPEAMDDDGTRDLKRAQVVKLITEKLHFPELKKWGIDLSTSGRYDNTGRSRIPEGKPVKH